MVVHPTGVGQVEGRVQRERAAVALFASHTPVRGCVPLGVSRLHFMASRAPFARPRFEEQLACRNAEQYGSCNQRGCGRDAFHDLTFEPFQALSRFSEARYALASMVR